MARKIYESVLFVHLAKCGSSFIYQVRVTWGVWARCHGYLVNEQGLPSLNITTLNLPARCLHSGWNYLYLFQISIILNTKIWILLHLWPVEHFLPHFGVPLVLQVPKSEEKSVQQVKGAFGKKWLLTKSIIYKGGQGCPKIWTYHTVVL